MIQDSKFNNSWKFLFSQKQDYQIAREHVFLLPYVYRISTYSSLVTNVSVLAKIFQPSIGYQSEYHVKLSHDTQRSHFGVQSHLQGHMSVTSSSTVYPCTLPQPPASLWFILILWQFMKALSVNSFLKKNVFFLHCICVQLWLLCCMFCWTCNLSYQIWL